MSDEPRTVAFRVLSAVSHQGGYANLELAKQLAEAGFSERDAGFVTELVNGTCRARGTYDLIIAEAGGRKLNSLQPAVVDVLRMATHQLLAMRIPPHAAINSSVELARRQIGQRVKGLVNAICRRISERSLDQWLDELTVGSDDLGKLALRTHHPRWIAAAFAARLPAAELPAALDSDNLAPQPHLAVHPGLLEVAQLPEATPAAYSPYGAYPNKPPRWYAAVRDGLAGVQDEGSQLVALALSRVDTVAGWWLDMCAGPGGKAALLNGLALQSGSRLLASERHPGRAGLVKQNLRGYPTSAVIAADGLRPPWKPGTFARVLADVPCTGLGALRRRPESRWTRPESALEELSELQHGLLASAIAAAEPGGVIGYVTCSPHLRETHEVVGRATGVEVLNAADYLPEVPDCADGRFVQLWPHRHGTDAMFLALLRKCAA
jgi:16S rRNA (cytosine967-C5)-methyltransferase